MVRAGEESFHPAFQSSASARRSLGLKEVSADLWAAAVDVQCVWRAGAKCWGNMAEPTIAIPALQI